MSISDRLAYNKLPIPRLDHLAESESYNTIMKFDLLGERVKVGANKWLPVPNTLVLQFLSKKKYEHLTTEDSISGFRFWYSKRGIINKLILIPEATEEILIEMGDATKEFREYFEYKNSIALNSYHYDSYKITDIPVKFRRPDTHINYVANNSIYIILEKVIPIK